MLTDVLDGDLAGAVLVHDHEGLLDHGESAVIELVAESAHELLVSDVAVLVDVVVLHESLQLDLRREEAG